MPNLFDSVWNQYNNGWKKSYGGPDYSDLSTHLDVHKAQAQAIADAAKKPGGVAPANAPGTVPAGRGYQTVQNPTRPQPTGPTRPTIDPRYPETWPPEWRRGETAPFGDASVTPTPQGAVLARAPGSNLPMAPLTDAAFVGAPLSGNQQYHGQPESEPSELSSTDTSGLAASGQSRVRLAGQDPSLTNIGGYKGSVASSLSSGLSGLTDFLGKRAGSKGGLFGGGGASGASGGGTPGAVYDAAGNLVTSDPNLTAQAAAGSGAYMGQGGAIYDAAGNVVDSSGALAAQDVGGSGATMGGMGGGGGGGAAGGGGMGGAGIASAVTGILSSFADQVAKANAPVTVDPSRWAGPLPLPVNFTFPALARNTGGNW